MHRTAGKFHNLAAAVLKIIRKPNDPMRSFSIDLFNQLLVIRISSSAIAVQCIIGIESDLAKNASSRSIRANYYN